MQEVEAEAMARREILTPRRTSVDMVGVVCPSSPIVASPRPSSPHTPRATRSTSGCSRFRTPSPKLRRLRSPPKNERRRGGTTVSAGINMHSLKHLKDALEHEAHVRACYMQTEAGHEPLLNAAIRRRCPIEMIEYLLACGASAYDAGVNVKSDAVDILLSDARTNPWEESLQTWAPIMTGCTTHPCEDAGVYGAVAKIRVDDDEWCCQVARVLSMHGVHIHHRAGAAERARSSGKPQFATRIERSNDADACRMLVTAARDQEVSKASNDDLGNVLKLQEDILMHAISFVSTSSCLERIISK